MILITSINAKAKQILQIEFQGKIIKLSLNYIFNSQYWLFDIEYGSFVRKNMILSLSSNLLNAYNNILPFGLSCLPSDTNDTVDPFFCDPENEISDFTIDRIRLFIVPISEVIELRNTLYSIYGIK